MPPTLRCPFRLTRPCSAAAAVNLASRSLSPCHKWNIHQERSFFAAVPENRRLSSRYSYKSAAIFSVLLLNSRKSSLIQKPPEHFPADINSVCRRRIVKRTCLGVDMVLHHGRSSRKHSSRIRSFRIITIVTPAGPIFFCTPPYMMPYFVMSTGSDRKQEETIRYKRDALRIRKGMKLRSVDRIVLTDVHIIRIPGSRQLTQIRDAGKNSAPQRRLLLLPLRTSALPSRLSFATARSEYSLPFCVS